MGDTPGTGSAGKGEESQTRTVNVPQNLQPLIDQTISTATGAIGSAEELAGQNMTAGFTPEQEEAFRLATGLAGGAGDFIPTAEQEFLNTAQGRDISSFLPETAFDALNASAGGQQSFEDTINPEALAALTGTAGGDFLFGGQGFDRAVEAAVNRAAPAVRSVFGSTAGGLSGGSAQEAIGNTAVDTFASQYGQERGRMQDAAGLLSRLSGRDTDRRLASSGLLSGIGNQERDRQLFAAGQLPGVGGTRSDILSDVGGARQAQAQAELSNPFRAQVLLAQLAQAGFPVEALLGGQIDGERNFFSLGFDNS